MKLTTVLFDLDGTLLPLEQDEFVRDYFTRLAQKLQPHGYDPKTLLPALTEATGAMMKNPGPHTNEQVFWTVFTARLGEGVRQDLSLFEDFYRSEFQQVRSVCGFDPAAGETVRELKRRGYRVALATSPLFPSIATESRIRWAGLEPEEFELFTTYEDYHCCKPNPDYYREVCANLGVQPEECLMVGNDALEDMIAETLGMRVFLLTDHLLNRDGRDISAYPQGSYPELMDLIRRIETE